MKLPFQKSACEYMQHILRECHNQEQTQEIRLSDGMPDIGRVLGGWGQMILRGKEWRSDSVAFSGGILVWVLYAPEDGTDPRCVESWIPFQMEWDIPADKGEGDMRVVPLLRFVDARSTAARKLMVRAGVAAQVEALVGVEAGIPRAEHLDSDIQLLQRTYPVRLIQEAGEKSFQLDEELSLPSGCPPVQKLLVYHAQPEVTEKRISGNRLIFRGNGNLHILYRGEEGNLYSCDFELPFSQLANLEKELGEAPQPDVMLCVTGLELDMNDDGAIRVKCGLVAQYLVNGRHMMEIVEDAYSPVRQVRIMPDQLNLPGILEIREETLSAEQILTQSASRIVDMTFSPDFPKQRRLGDQLELVVPGQMQVLYYGEDGAIQSSTARWEGVFRMPAAGETRIYGMVYPKGSGQAFQSNGQIRLKPEITLGIETQNQQGISLVTGLELGPQRESDSNRPSLILRRAGEDGLWSIAKNTGTTMDAIREANGLAGEPEADQMLLIPVS